MKSKWRMLAGMLVGLGTLCLFAGKAQAANPSDLDVEVTITQNLSVSVNGAQSSTQTVTWNIGQSSFVASGQANYSSATVTNNSGGQTESWWVSTDTGSDATGGWSLVTTTITEPGLNSYAVQAVFGSSITAASGTGACPIAAAGDWNQAYAPPLTGVPVEYTSSLFADPDVVGNTPTSNVDPDSGVDMFNNSIRGLCWRLYLPSNVSIFTNQTIQVIVTAGAP